VNKGKALAVGLLMAEIMSLIFHPWHVDMGMNFIHEQSNPSVF